MLAQVRDCCRTLRELGDSGATTTAFKLADTLAELTALSSVSPQVTRRHALSVFSRPTSLPSIATLEPIVRVSCAANVRADGG